MDKACLDHRLTEDERRQFDERGCFVVPNALPPALLTRLVDAVDRLEAEYRPLRGLEPSQPLNHLDCIGYDDAFLELLEWPKTIARVIDILGWHIQLYHSHLIVTPPLPPDHGAEVPPAPLAPGQRAAEPGPRDRSAPAGLPEGRFPPDGHVRARPRQLPRRAGQPPAQRAGVPGGGRGTPGGHADSRACRGTRCSSTGASGTPRAATGRTSPARPSSSVTATAGCGRGTT